MPDSPLIERPILSTQEEDDLKEVCRLVLTNVKSTDDSGTTDPLSDIISSLQAQEALPKQDNHTVDPLASDVPHFAAITVEPYARPKYSGAAGEALRPVSTRNDSSLAGGVLGHTKEETLSILQKRMSSRPKTATAVGTDYTAETTNPSSKTSNRTTFSTPATSIFTTGTSGRVSKRCTQLGTGSATDIPAVPRLSLLGPPSGAESPSHVYAWMDEQSQRHSQEEAATAPTIALKDFYPTQPLSQERNSVRDNIKEYFRPGSSNGKGSRRQSTFGANIMNYVRPGSAVSVKTHETNLRPSSAAGSARSITSTRSRTHEKWSSFKKRLSSASRTSPGKDLVSLEYGDRNDYFQQDSQVNLNRPLPALPGLDSYKEKPTHIASLMVNVSPRKADSVMPPPSNKKNAKQRHSNISIPAAWPGSTISIVNGSEGKTAKSTTSLGSPPMRPYTAKSGNNHNPGFSPLSQSTVPKADAKKGFAKWWGGKFAVGKKARVVVAS